jgi:uncharacterized membrane protein
MKRIGVIAILILAFCGLADAAYLAQHVANNTPVICNIQGLSDCNAVITSQYSHPFGIPLAYVGVFFYGILFIFAALELFIFDSFLRRLLQAGAIVGIIASIYFVSLQAFVIHAFCEYCLLSALITLLMIFFAIFIEPMKPREVVPIPQVDSPPPRLTMPPVP